ncbi:MAG: hypothetical protein QOE30_3552 [Mycobacterium sp.]|nr:hypothetical protein [Mycobacterium sp.]
MLDPPAAGAGQPARAAVVGVGVVLKAVRWVLRWVKCAVLSGVRESRIGSTRGSRRVEHHPVRDSGTAVGGVIGTVRSQPMTRRTTRSGQPERSSSRFTLQFRWREPSVGRSFRNSRSVFARRGLG